MPASGAGVGDCGFGFALPSWPSSLEPQHRPLPPPHAQPWAYPIATPSSVPTPMASGLGEYELVVLVSPSCPLYPLPQQWTLAPTAAHTDLWPSEIALAEPGSTTAAGAPVTSRSP